jgi:ABC-type sugar transport system permease subunit
MIMLILVFMHILLPMLMPILMFYLISINSYKVQNQI